MHAFGITEEDLENVLRKHWARIVNSGGKSFEHMADDLFSSIDEAAVEGAALKGGVELEEQTDAAYEELERQLVERGVLAALRPERAAPTTRKARP